LPELTQQQLVALLDEWVGSEVAVRVVSDGDDLIAVLRGRVGRRSEAKQPALFWPLLARDRAQVVENGLEEPGIYLHADAFHDACVHQGGFVLELRQAGVTINIRRL
jgi:hypothetical protein